MAVPQWVYMLWWGKEILHKQSLHFPVQTCVVTVVWRGDITHVWMRLSLVLLNNLMSSNTQLPHIHRSPMPNIKMPTKIILCSLLCVIFFLFYLSHLSMQYPELVVLFHTILCIFSVIKHSFPTTAKAWYTVQQLSSGKLQKPAVSQEK